MGTTKNENRVDILLINPGNYQIKNITEHLGIACLKSYISSKNFSVDTIDLSLDQKTNSDTIQDLLKINPRMIGFSLLNATAQRGLKLIQALRKSGYAGKIVIGGYFATFASREILTDFPEIDYIIRGEGEYTLEELLNFQIRQQGNLNDILGLSFRHDSNITENPTRPLIVNLDMLPPPDRKYANVVLNNNSPLRIYGTRGCWGQCAFCDIIGLYGISKGKAWRRRSVINLVNEIESLHSKYNTDYFIFNDDQFLVKGKKGSEFVEEFAGELEKRSLNIKFELMCRADTVNNKMMLRLREVGLQRVFLGLESFDAKQLSRYNKNISVRQNLKAVITLYKLKIDVIASLILADAYTTLWDLLNQFVVLFQMKKKYFNSKHCQISINKKMEIYKGSNVYKEYLRNGLLTKDHYIYGVDYNLRFWTKFRLRILGLEEFISRVTFNPRLVIDEFKNIVKYKIAYLK